MIMKTFDKKFLDANKFDNKVVVLESAVNRGFQLRILNEPTFLNQKISEFSGIRLFELRRHFYHWIFIKAKLLKRIPQTYHRFEIPGQSGVIVARWLITNSSCINQNHRSIAGVEQILNSRRKAD